MPRSFRPISEILVALQVRSRIHPRPQIQLDCHHARHSRADQENQCLLFAIWHLLKQEFRKDRAEFPASDRSRAIRANWNWEALRWYGQHLSFCQRSRIVDVFKSLNQANSPRVQWLTARSSASSPSKKSGDRFAGGLRQDQRDEETGIAITHASRLPVSEPLVPNLVQQLG